MRFEPWQRITDRIPVEIYVIYYNGAVPDLFDLNTELPWSHDINAEPIT